MRLTLTALFALLLVACSRDNDPFFDKFPRRYTYSGTSIKEGARMYIAGNEIFDTALIRNYAASGGRLLTLRHIDSVLATTQLNFVNSNTAKYSGIYNYLYDTLTYVKDGNTLKLKTETIKSQYAAFLCKTIPCRVTSWTIDSLGLEETWPGWAPITYSAFNKRYSIINSEIHVPVLAFKFTSPDFGVVTFQENEFNENIVRDLRLTDSLLVIKFDVVLKEK